MDNIEANVKPETWFIYSKLNEFCKKHEIVSVFSDENAPTKFCAGFILDISNGYVLIAHITPAGLYDGYIIKKIEDIFKLKSDDEYCVKVIKLYNIQKQTHSKIPKTTDSPIINLLHYANEHELIVCGELVDSEYDDFQGYVVNISNGYVTIKCIDDFGKENGTVLFLADDITHLVCDSESEISLKLLFENT